MNAQTEAVMSLIAALLVLFSAMWDPWVSATLAVILLVAFAAYKFVYARRDL
ncbi:MAG: hypothetical protein R3C14_19355 [Caldilineaceae bacterium]